MNAHEICQCGDSGTVHRYGSLECVAAAKEEATQRALVAVAEAAEKLMAWTYEGQRPPPAPGSMGHALVTALAAWKKGEGK